MTAIGGAPPSWSFGNAAARLLDNGYHPLPIKPGTKRPVLPEWQRFCGCAPAPATVASWAAKFPSWGIGAATGFLVAIDIDLMDEGQAVEMQRSAERTFGETPLVRIGQAPKRVLLYSCSTPFQNFKAGQIEVLGLGRQVVLFAIHPDTGRPYTWISATPLEVPVSALPEITEETARRWLAPEPIEMGERNRTLSAAPEPIEMGERNRTLFGLALKASAAVTSYEDLVSGLRAINDANCSPPLPLAEVERVAQSAWRYRQAGLIYADDGERRAVLTEGEFDKYADDPDALVLLVFLRLQHGPGASSIAVSPGAMANARLISDWSKKRYAEARNALLLRGGIELEREGTGRGNANLYRLVEPAPPTLVKGVDSWRNVIIHTSPAPPAVEGQQGSGDPASQIEASATAPEPVAPPPLVNIVFKKNRHQRRLAEPATAQHDIFAGGTLPEANPWTVIRKALEAHLRKSPRGEHVRIAAALHIDSSTLSNFLAGRDGLNTWTAHQLAKILGVPGLFREEAEAMIGDQQSTKGA